MEHSELRRRSQVNIRTDIPLIYKLVLLLRSHKEYKIVATSSSLSFRVVCLCEMAMKSVIKYDERLNVVQSGAPESDIEREFIYKIAMMGFRAQDLVRALNCEFSKSYGIKHLKSKIFKEMENRSMIKITRCTLFNKIGLNNIDLWGEIHNGLLSDCKAGPSLESKILLLALDYVNKMESFLLLCNEKDASSAVKCLADFKNELRENRCQEKDQIVFDFLKVLVKY